MVTYLTVSYYLHIFNNVVDKEHHDIYLQKRTWMIILLVIGGFSVIITYMGLAACGVFGICGLVKVFIDMYTIMQGQQGLKYNLLPLSAIFVTPMFYIVILQFLNYITMIYKGVNQKTQASIKRFNIHSEEKYVTIRSIGDGLQNLFMFFCWRTIPPSELLREMTVDAQLEYEFEPDALEERDTRVSMDAHKKKAFTNGHHH